MAPLKGIAFKLGAVTMFMVMASLIKATADSVPPGQAVFFRSLFAFPILTQVMALTFFRALFGCARAKHPAGLCDQGR